LFQGCPMGGSWGRHELAHNANRICNVRIMACRYCLIGKKSSVYKIKML
jgi:hypothetical protein